MIDLRSLLRRLLREPLVHFALVGAVLFAVAESRRRAGKGPADAAIVVDAHVKQQLAEAFRSSQGRPPSAEDLAEQVRRHVDEEVLYREGLARRLHVDDPRVRQRVAEKMAMIVRSQILVPEPSAAEIESWFGAHRERWSLPALVDFVHVFIQGHDPAATARAAELLEKLQTGAEPAGLGDRFSGGRRYRGRKLSDLAESFGEEFVRAMGEQPVGQWALRRSRFGLHLVRIDARTAPRAPPLEEVRLEVVQQWKAAERDRLFAARLAELRRRWPIEERD